MASRRPLRLIGRFACSCGPAADQVRFFDVAPETGTTRLSWGPGAAFADLDGDGRLDLVLYVFNGGFAGRQANQVLRNDVAAGGGFVAVSATSCDGDLNQTTFGGTTLDDDRDELLDVFLADDANQGCNPLRNEGGLVFRNVSVEAGIAQTEGHHRH
jgi:hypothetical protein